MILYNVTVIIVDSIQAEWLDWIEGQHIPAVMETGLFVSSRLLKVLDSPNEGTTYCMQFIAESFEQFDLYKKQFSSLLETDHNEKFKGYSVTFSTLMEFVET